MWYPSPPDPNPGTAAPSLLSLSIAAETAAPIPVEVTTEAQAPGAEATADVGHDADQQQQGSLSTSVGAKNRRLSAVTRGKRLSDAREAAMRPSPVGSLSMSSLSLSSSPGAPHPPAARSSSSHDIPVIEATSTYASLPAVTAPIAIGHGKHAKKRGLEYKCESCSKVYRHPSCLIKHRWEHTPHWREASKYVLSKHQQVQLLEAAAILSHISPSAQGGTSLPEDRSLWPSFLTGGSLPREDNGATGGWGEGSGSLRCGESGGSLRHEDSSSPQGPHTSASAPIRRAGSTGPRLHDYSVPEAAGGITHLRPGIVGVPTGPPAVEEICLSPFGVTSAPVRVSPVSVPERAVSTSSSPSHAPPSSAPAQAWGYGRQSVRTPSSLSRSYSGSASDDDESVVVDIDDDAHNATDAGKGSHNTYLGSASNSSYLGSANASYLGSGPPYVGQYGYLGMAGYMKPEDDDDFPMRQDELDLRAKPAVKQQDEWGGMDVDMDMD
ncbi:hypothetical protein FB107DRAFT_257977 [Schizophyllum commune]